jgi:peptidoglycan/xylan/chitin deacetylase (PgdA/CDA1 family)
MSKLGLLIVLIVVVGFASFHHKSSASTRAVAAPHSSTRSAPKQAQPTPMAVPDKIAQEAAIDAGMPAWPTVNRQYGPARSMASTGTTTVALTFDDGPSGYTNDVLDLLDRYHVKATFCVIGDQVQSAINVIQRIVADGHTLCNHSWSHDESLGRKSVTTMTADLKRTDAAIRRAVPGARIGYYRQPGGNFTTAVVRVAEQLGMRPLYWSVDPRDWTVPGTFTIESALADNIHSGSIVLMHDGGGDRTETLNALRTLLPWLANHFKLAPLPR